MEDSIASRLKAFITYLGINDSSFADKCGISRSTLSLLLSGRNKKVSDQQIAQIHYAFPELSIVWLMFGEGSMIIGPQSEDENEENELFSDSEISENVTSDAGLSEDLNLKALSRADKTINQLTNTQLELQEKIRNLESKILKMESEPRRVSKITIFYDDSTFETFIPEKKEKQG
ncbi:MAG: hypothetical protein HDR95_01250 [Bacteroides sp.]|nr:hypothetical protein [Bacteroides sp.]MBD5335927.1 hypothetical protein [Bacteroides sp.]